MNILFKCSTTVLFVFRKLYKKSSGKNIFLIITILSSQHVKTQLQSLVLTNILQLLLQRYIINLLSFIKPEVIKLLVWGSLLFGFVFCFWFWFCFCFLFVCLFFVLFCFFCFVFLRIYYEVLQKPKCCNTYLWLRPNSILVNTAGAPFDGRDSNTIENVIYYEMTESYAYNKHIITYIQAYMRTVNNQHK